MKLDQAGQLAVVGPIVHVFVSFVFLYGYSSGFGGGVESIFSATDIFGISLTDMMFVYIVGFIVPFVISANQFRPGYKTLADKLMEEGTEESLEKLKEKQKSAKFWVTSVMIFATIPILIQVIVGIKYDSRIPYAELNVYASGLIPLIWLNFASKLNTSFLFDRFIAIIVTLIGCALIVGLSRGQAERRYDFEEFSSSNMRCGQYVILRGASDRFIAIENNGSRLIIDENCGVVLRLPYRKKFEDASPMDLFVRMLGFADDPSSTRQVPLKENKALTKPLGPDTK